MHNILYLDVFSEDTSYIIRGKKHYRTWIGVFLSLLIIIASVIFAFMFGEEVYKREKPTVSNSEEFLLNSRVEMTDYPIYMFITDHRGRKIENIRNYYEINTFKMSISQDNKIEQSGFTPQHAVVRCQARHFSAIRGKISDIEIEQILAEFSYCIDYDKDGFVQNPHTRNSTFLNIEFNICNKTANTCAEDLDTIVKEAYIQLFYINTYIDSNDYDNPVKYYYYNHNTQVSDSFFKRNFISIGNNEYLSDDGWIIESIRTIKYLSLSNIKFEINSMSPNDPLLVLMTTFNSPNIRVKSNRTYMKIQDLFAKIGGIINALIIAVSIVFSHYFRFNFNMNLRKHLNPSDDNYKERRITNLLNMSINNNEIKNNFASKNETLKVKIEDKNLDEEKNKKEVIKVNESSNNNFSKTNDYNINTDVNKGLLLKRLNINVNNNNNNNYNNLKNALTQEQILSNNYIKPLQQFKSYENHEDNNENRLSVRYKTLGNESKENTHSNISESDSSTFHFQYIDFTGLNYFKYLYNQIFCTKELKKYKVIKKEIESLLDFFVYCNYLKHQYLLKDPRELKE